jgi:hypothetical protein
MAAHGQIQLTVVRMPAHAAMRCGIELLADKILVSQMVRSASVQPLCRAVLVEQAHGDGPRGDARVAGQLSGRVHKQCRAPPLERPGHRDLVNQRNAAAWGSGIAGLPRDPA